MTAGQVLTVSSAGSVAVSSTLATLKCAVPRQVGGVAPERRWKAIGNVTEVCPPLAFSTNAVIGAVHVTVCAANVQGLNGAGPLLCEPVPKVQLLGSTAVTVIASPAVVAPWPLLVTVMV